MPSTRPVRKSLTAYSDEHRPQIEEILAGFAPVMDGWMPALAELVTAAHAATSGAPEVELPVPDESRRLATAVPGGVEPERT